jgi:hypothetical protein
MIVLPHRVTPVFKAIKATPVYVIASSVKRVRLE